ncbi:MAG: UDP-N-acetylmuramoyl-L-alanyl-D-glutamate--2,6-diaminopimelate ligase, partial [Oscillospiraceae bacterium]|nr:UDP-N-acetylmuramoyl-L-alanyl-D-glutamate--2,6-diaminopimelate ligase [Oscillospiraceae bacterium]
ELSGQHCSHVYITEEDSGEEPFESIAGDIAKYVTCPHTILEDRDECIRRAICEHHDRRVILLTGKGEETRMKRGTEYVDFPSDVEMTLRHLKTYDEKRN